MAILLACVALAPVAIAQQAPPTGPDAQPAAQPASADPGQADPDEKRQIVVIGDRTIIAALKDLEVEQTYDADRAASYGVNTVGELLEQVRNENGDNDPALLINGRPANDNAEISDLPVEAIARVEVLPRGAATKIGGAGGQRAYNVVLKKSLSSLTLTGSRQLATEGEWGATRLEATVTRIKQQDRINLTLRMSDSDPLFETDRNLLPLPEPIPFSASGNLIPASGSDVSPALSALAGQTANTVALPTGNSTPTLASLVPGVNRITPSLLGDYRTLRGASRTYEAGISGNKELAPWLGLAFSGRLNWSNSTGQSGLPSARFLIPASNGFTPFANSVVLALNDPSRPLKSRSNSDGVSLSASFNANFGDWRATLAARYDERERLGVTDLNGPIAGGTITAAPTVNPFTGTLAATIPVSQRSTFTRTSTPQILTDIDGPLFDLPAGPVRVRGGAAITWANLDGYDTTNGPRSFSRSELLLKNGITIPLTGRDPEFLSGLGETELNIDWGRLFLSGGGGEITRHTFALNWRPNTWLRLSLSENEEGRATPAELFAAPVSVAENVPYFDPITGETVYVTTVYGGAANLRNESQRNRVVSATVSPLARYNLQFNADYSVIDRSNQIGALPPPSSAVVLAFPDRFVRDGTGRLVLVDSRTINLANQHSRQLRLGMNASIPLRGSGTGTTPRRGPPTMLNLNVAHTFLFENTMVIRTGLPEVDLLKGGAIGIGGGQQRHIGNASVALTRGGTGIRLFATWQGSSFLQSGTLAAPDLVTFKTLAKFDLRAFADLGQVFPKSNLAKGTRVSLAVENLGNSRLDVFNSAGVVPLGFQPVYRDPVGRTVSFELRKVF